MVFVAVAGLLSWAYSFSYAPGSGPDLAVRAYLEGYTRVAAVAVRIVDPSARALGNVLQGRFAIALVRDCDAAETHILFVAGEAASMSRTAPVDRARAAPTREG